VSSRVQEEHYCRYCGSPLLRLLSKKECAELLSVSTDFIDDHIAKGTIDTTLIKSPKGSNARRPIRIPISELHKLVEYRPGLDSMVRQAIEERT